MAIQGATVRTLDSTNDWTFGNNLGGYLTGNTQIRQSIQCRLNQFYGECFWDTQAGINWFGWLGGKNPQGLTLAIATVILNTPGVLGLVPGTLSFSLDAETRVITINWSVVTVYSTQFPGTSTLTLAAA